MFGDQKDTEQNLKDSSSSLDITIKDSSLSVSYPRLNKLITALYIVTDIMDKEEPIRTKLRTLGVEILSDINSLSTLKLNEKIQAILSFLDIASAVNLVSEMNFNILQKEFLAMRESIKESKQVNPAWLEEFLAHSAETSEARKNFDINLASNNKGHSVGRPINNQRIKTRIGVQKGSTLMKALSDKTNSLSDINFSTKDRNSFDLLKKQRREEIIKSIKDNSGNATITDIKAKASGSLSTCGEKTLQRELMSMIKDGVLNKTGEKRWSRYFVIA